jgi:hypothetical protein
MAICTAHKTDGSRCKANAIAGGRVCRAHGGGCPQVVAKAKLRLAIAADAITKRLVTIVLSKKTKPSDAIAAGRDLLDRAGVRADRSDVTYNADAGAVLWEEFVEIHRRVTDGRKDAKT